MNSAKRRKIEENNFEARLRITNFYPYKSEIVEVIQKYMEKNYSNVEYKIENENSKLLIVNFLKNTEVANCILREIKLYQLEKNYLSQMNATVGIKVNNSISEKNFKESANCRYLGDNTMDAKLSSKKPSSSKKSISSKSKVLESIFLDQGPYMSDFDVENVYRKQNKALWLKKKGFSNYVSTNDIEKNRNDIKYFWKEDPFETSKDYKYRELAKDKWVGRKDFYAFAKGNII